MTRRSGTLLLLSLALLPAGIAAPPAAGQDRGGGVATEVSDELPLEPAAGHAAARSQRGGRGPATAGVRALGDGGSGPSIPLLLGALGALAAAGLVLRLRFTRRGRAPAGHGGPPPAGSPRPTSEFEASPPEQGPAADTAPHRDAPARAPVQERRGRPAPPRGEGSRHGRESPTRRRPPAQAARALGYASVPATDGQHSDDLKLQDRLIREACRRRGLTLVDVVRDVESHAGSDLRRPGLTHALERLAAHDASCLVVASTERLTRTAAHLGTMLGRLDECDARLVVIDLDLDTGTHEGRLGAKALATAGVLERRKVEERTQDGPEAPRATRRSGRPAVSDRPSLKQRIADMRAQGMTLQAIADTLNAEGVPTVRGGAEWRPSSVQAAAGYKRPSRRDRPRADGGASRDNRA